jgi:hypothetical protein
MDSGRRFLLIAVLSRALALSPVERGRAVEATLFLLIVRVAFATLPFAVVLRLFGIVQGETHAGRIAAPEAREVSRAVLRAARHVPFRAVCLQQAFAALLMLRRRGLAATVHLGLAREQGTGVLIAHAWSRCGNLPVTGGPLTQPYAPIAVFA